jgi:hypothetical protein
VLGGGGITEAQKHEIAFVRIAKYHFSDQAPARIPCSLCTYYYCQRDAYSHVRILCTKMKNKTKAGRTSKHHHHHRRHPSAFMQSSAHGRI